MKSYRIPKKDLKTVGINLTYQYLFFKKLFVSEESLKNLVKK